MFDITVESNIDQILLQIPDSLHLKRSILEKVTGYVKGGIENDLFQGLDFMQNPVQPKKKGGRVFYDTGELFRSVKDEYGLFESKIFIGDNRAEVAGWLQDGTENMVARPFFGITPDSLQKIDDLFAATPFWELFEIEVN